MFRLHCYLLQMTISKGIQVQIAKKRVMVIMNVGDLQSQNQWFGGRGATTKMSQELWITSFWWNLGSLRPPSPFEIIHQAI